MIKIFAAVVALAAIVAAPAANAQVGTSVATQVNDNGSVSSDGSRADILPSPPSRRESAVVFAGATASSYADLTTGKVGGYAMSGLNQSVTAYSKFYDELVFTIAGATASTITPIGLTWTVHGSSEDLDSARGELAIWTSQITLGGANTFASWNTNSGFSTGGGGFASGMWTGGGPNGAQFTGTYNLVGETQRLVIQGMLDLDARGPFLLDFANTAGVNFVLTPQVTYTSASGVFLSAAASAVPEPGTWTMLIIGFAAVGAALRRRRAIPAASSTAYA